MPGPLAGIRVVDFGRYAVAPPAASYLGQLGADVIKIESPTGDNSKNIPPLKGGVSIPYITVNSNKRNILLNLREPDDLEVAKRLVSISDVVLENFRPGVMENLGLGYEDASTINPGIIYCSASGFGNRGPMKLLGSTDHFGQAMGGVVALTGMPGGEPQFLRQGGFIDISTAQRMVQGILCALYIKDLTGLGQKVETSQMEAGIGLVATRAQEYFATGKAPELLGSASAVCVPHQDFETSDGRRLCVAAETQDQWRALCAAIGKLELAGDERFVDNRHRVENRAALIPLLKHAFRTRTAEAWLEALIAAGVPCILQWTDATYRPLKADAHSIANGLFDDVETPWGTLELVSSPWRFSETPAKIARAPGLDEHADEIRELAATAATGEPVPGGNGQLHSQPAGKPLAGLRVIDISQGYAGPYCSQQLGDLGADVVKVEPPSGDYSRELGPPFVEGESAVYLALNRSKRSVVLDPTTADGIASLEQLLADADVLISDLQPHLAQSRGLDYDHVKKLNPNLIYCSITPFGETGPYSGRPGSELVMQVAAGVSRFLGPLGEPPLRLGADAAGTTAGTYAFIGIMAALVDRKRRGAGQKLEVSQLHSLLSTQCSQIARESDPDEWTGAVTAASDPPEYPIKTADMPVHAGVGVGRPDEQFLEFLTSLGLAALMQDQRFALAADRQKNQRALMPLLRQRFLELPATTVLAAVHKLGGNAVPAHSFTTLFEDEQVKIMGMVVEVTHPTIGRLEGVDVPFDLIATPHKIDTPPPLLGEHTDKVLAELSQSRVSVT